MALTVMQQEYLQNCNHRWNIKVGATGSGKTFLDAAVVIPKRIVAARDEGLIVLMGNTQGTLERNVLEPMRQLYPTLVSQISSNNTVKIFGKKCYALGADNKKHIARIQGPNFEYMYGDEMATWAQGVMEMAKSRLRCEHSAMDGTTNPDNPNHWLKKFLDSDADIYQQSYTIDDNPYLPEKFVTELKKEYAGTVYYGRYILGQWVAAEGTVYKLFADSPTRFKVGEDWQKEHPCMMAHIGVDFGGNQSGHAFTLTGIEAGYRGLVTLDEWYHKGEITPEVLEKAFVDFVQSALDKFKGTGTILTTAFCDSAETTLIMGLRQAIQKAGIPLDVVKARKSPINDRIRFLCRMMAAGRYHIAEHCKVTTEALQSALWNSKRVTEDVRLDDGTTNIDSLDALEYSYESIMQTMSDMGVLM